MLQKKYKLVGDHLRVEEKRVMKHFSAHARHAEALTKAIAKLQELLESL